MRSKSQILSKLRADGHITDKEYKMLEQEPCDELDFVQPHKKVSLDLEVCKMREANKEEREGIEKYIDSIAEPCEACEDCISRQAVLNEFENDQYHLEFCIEHGIDRSISMEMVRIRLHDMPPVTLQPKTGHWVEENINEWSRKVFCSECGCPPPFEHISNGDVYSASGYGVSNKTKFCPNCGAMMIESWEARESEK